MTASPDLASRVAAVRRFSRFYTRRIGVLHEGLLGSPLSLAEGRVIYELAQRDHTTATALAGELELDPGYLSRIVRDLEGRRLLRKRPSATDGRQTDLSLSAAGRRAYADIDARSSGEIAAMLATLSPGDQRALVDAMTRIESLLGAAPPATPYILRPHRAGDMGWVVHRHGILYAEEYGWDERFEALVAQIVAEFLLRFDPRRERCWIAERDGAIVGSVFLVKHTDDTAKLRLLLVEPSARGLGIGARLVSECVTTARQLGYRTLTLWTNSVLTAARHLYERAGFTLVSEEPHHSFGKELVSQTWELGL